MERSSFQSQRTKNASKATSTYSTSVWMMEKCKQFTTWIQTPDCWRSPMAAAANIILSIWNSEHVPDVLCVRPLTSNISKIQHYIAFRRIYILFCIWHVSLCELRECPYFYSREWWQSKINETKTHKCFHFIRIYFPISFILYNQNWWTVFLLFHSWGFHWKYSTTFLWFSAFAWMGLFKFELSKFHE